MPLAGESIIAGQVPGERIATDIVTADSSTFTTTETSVQSVTAALVSGRIYRVRWCVHWGSSVEGDRVQIRIREDSGTSGTILQEFTGESTAAHGGSSLGEYDTPEAEYTAVSTGNKTFSGTMVRSSGTGNVQLEGASTRPNYMYVDYIRG